MLIKPKTNKTKTKEIRWKRWGENKQITEKFTTGFYQFWQRKYYDWNEKKIQKVSVAIGGGSLYRHWTSKGLTFLYFERNT